MKLWIITSEFPGELTTGGIARYVENIAQALSETRADITVITRAKTNYHSSVTKGFSIIGFASDYDHLTSEANSTSLLESSAFPYNVISYWPALSYQTAVLIEKLINQLGPPDVIECQEYGALPYYLLQKKLLGHSALAEIPIVVHCHSPSFVLAEANHQPTAIFPDYWVGEMEKFCISAADALLCPSHFLAQQITDRVFHKDPIEVIPLPHTPQTTAISPTFSFPSASPTVLYFGRLELRKGVLKALESIETLWNANENFRVVLIGDDTEFMPRGTTIESFIRARYSQQIQNGRLRILSSCDWEKLQEHILAAQIVIVPSLWENFPNTCIEAMSLGRVVLASKHGGQVELIGSDGKNGFLFDWDVHGDFSAKLSYILKLSPSERKETGKNARKRVIEYCSLEKVVIQRFEHFKRIIKRHQKPAFFPAPWLNYRLPASLQEANTVFVPNKEKEHFSPKKKEQSCCLLSVVIPYYNLGRYIKDAVQSVLRSTLAPDEILIVDDCSTGEENLGILRELESRYPSVQIIHHPFNKGLATTRNTGAKEARGKFIAFLDADDEVEPTFFEKALPVLEAYPNVGFVYSWVQFFENSQAIWPTWNAHFPYLLGHNMLTPICIVRKEAFLEVGGNNPKFEYSLEDYECWVNLLKHGWLGASLPECLTRYRVREGSMLRSATEDQFRYLYDLLIQTHPELYQHWGSELARLQIANGSGISWQHPAVVHSAANIQATKLCQQITDSKLSQAIQRLHRSAPARLLLKQPLIRQTLRKTLNVISKI